MIKRYLDPKFERIWSDQNRYQKFLEVELACSYAHFKVGLLSEATYQRLTKATFTLNEIETIEKETRHDVVAFIKAVSKSLGPAAKWFHYGLTSTDIVDTAYGLLLKEANELIEVKLMTFIETIKSMALQYKDTYMMGRTHGMHADLTTFGLKFVHYYEQLQRHLHKFRLARSEIEVGKISGAVGNFAQIDPQIQTIACEKLGLNEVKSATQVISRDRHAFYLQVLALLATTIEAIALEVRHLSRTEVGEVEEGFVKNQTGSSAMPHKKNPIASENMSGIARMMRSFLHVSSENMLLWHERDISHSSAERMYLMDATSLIYYMLNRYEKVLKHLIVHEEKMLENIELNYGTVFSQKVLKAFIQKGLDRETAYEIIQKLSFEAMNKRINLKDLIQQDDQVGKLLTEEEVAICFDLNRYLKHIDHIYQNVGIV